MIGSYSTLGSCVRSLNFVDNQSIRNRSPIAIHRLALLCLPCPDRDCDHTITALEDSWNFQLCMVLNLKQNCGACGCVQCECYICHKLSLCAVLRYMIEAIGICRASSRVGKKGDATSKCTTLVSTTMFVVYSLSTPSYRLAR